jgi:SAM-dependent methyltransferase
MQIATEPREWTTIEELCDRHLGSRPSPAVLPILKPLEHERQEVRDFIARTFQLMELSRFDVKDFSPMMAGGMTVLPSILPGAWGGMVPPVTQANRHARIDTYLRSNPWASFGAGTVLLDVGCGFPPQTSMDASKSFPDWQIIGADPAFDEYVLYDEDGHYACLDARGRVRYFQPGRGNPASWMALFNDPEATRRRFSEAFVELAHLLPPDDGQSSIVEQDRRRLVRYPLRSYETSNLKFLQAGFGSPTPQADVVRSFNVLMYFDGDFRHSADQWLATVLRPGGLFVCGTGGPSEVRYAVYRKEDDCLVEKEFAFGVENVRPFAWVPWMCLHNGERETWRLAEMIAILRSDPQFLRDYNARLDTLLQEHGLLVREGSGFLAIPKDGLDPSQYFAANEAIGRQMQEEFTDRAVAVLGRAGLHAWRNSADHVAVGPQAPSAAESGTD